MIGKASIQYSIHHYSILHTPLPINGL